MDSPVAAPGLGVALLFNFVGGLIMLGAWVILIIAAFKVKAGWGFLVLLGPIAVGLVAGMNPWINLIGDLFVMSPFLLPRLDQKKILVCISLFVIGSLVTVPAWNAINNAEGAQEKARITAAEKPAPPPAPVTTYTLPPVEPAPVRAKSQLKVVDAPPDIVAPEIVQVYVVNATKTFYPLDCGKQPDGSYKMSKSMAVRQGYKLAKECGQ